MYQRLYLLAGNLILPLRLVLGWTYFSAFWRRLVLENKLIPDQAGYIGEKFNHFLPNALFIDGAIEFFVSHPTLLWWKLVIFTLVEAVVGLALILGFATRAAGIATSMLAVGILLGAGWLGTTCLDEWQIGSLGVAAGFAIAGAGGGRFSLDHLIHGKAPQFMEHPWVNFITGLRPSIRFATLFSVAGGAVALFLTLFTNQVFHGGVWGKLHNLSVRPKVELSEATLRDDALSVRFYRVEGADVYGSFAIGVTLKDSAGAIVAQWDADALAKLPTRDIANHFVAKIKPGAHSLVLPLGAKADVTLHHPALSKLAPGTYRIELLDISGLSWHTELTVGTNET